MKDNHYNYICSVSTSYVKIVYLLCEFSGFCHGTDDVFPLLGCYAAYVPT